MKYSITFRTEFGSISAESSKPRDLIQAHKRLREIAERLDDRRIRSRKLAPRKPVRFQPFSRRSKNSGQGETARILREIESKLLLTDFFSSPKSTGDTKSKLDKLGNKFTSRKVSQALGILKNKGILERSGSKNKFKYRK